MVIFKKNIILKQCIAYFIRKTKNTAKPKSKNQKPKAENQKPKSKS